MKQLRGIRFAPSPTGRFHVGNLRTAWVAREWARQLDEPLIIRFEDIDKPRVLPGSADLQLADMAALNIVAVVLQIQSARHGRHFELFKRGIADGILYPCYCSRKEVLDALRGIASAPHHGELVYDGRCRNSLGGGVSANPGLAWRFRGSDDSGRQDFIVARTGPDPERVSEADFVPAYHWACGIDDWDGAYKLLVRAWDLKASAVQQKMIQTWLSGGEVPKVRIFHTSLVVGAGGERLEKRTKGVTLPELSADGISVAAILQSFSRSFREEWCVSTAFPWGEVRETISLNELLGERQS